MRAAEVMRTSFATVKLSTPLIDAARLLLETNQRGLPVLDDGDRLVGIVTKAICSIALNLASILPATGSRPSWASRRVDASGSVCAHFASPGS